LDPLLSLLSDPYSLDPIFFYGLPMLAHVSALALTTPGDLSGPISHPSSGGGGCL
jgi:hypothetical protein